MHFDMKSYLKNNVDILKVFVGCFQVEMHLKMSFFSCKTHKLNFSPTIMVAEF